MKIKEVVIKGFKRFTDLTVTDIPESTRLVVLVGPNGSGKTSLLEAFNHWYQLYGFNSTTPKEYSLKKGSPITADNWYQNKVKVSFHDQSQITGNQIKGKFYFRTAYRNEPDFTVSSLNKQADPTSSVKLKTLMLNDTTVSENYQRLISQTLSGVFESKNNSKTVEQLRDEIIGKIKSSLSNIFDDLNLSSIGDPLSNGSFYFEKGSSKDFHYKNLSAGEKSVFDLLLDIIIKTEYFSNAVFCIDEPEAHMHTRLQSKLLNELYHLLPDESQLWISTHSIGMLKQAEELERSNPGSIVFLDFDGKNFDLTERIQPSRIDRTIWNRFFELALADFSSLISPRRIVFCEGTSQGRIYKNFDAQIYAIVFENKYHDTRFVSVGSCSEIENENNETINILSNILETSEVIKFVDRDDKSDNEVNELAERGVKASRRRHIECYLFDDELIIKLCTQLGKVEFIDDCLAAKIDAISESIERGNPEDDIKSASGKIFTELKAILNLTQCGNNKCAFVRDTMAPLLTEETDTYLHLESEIFGENKT